MRKTNELHDQSQESGEGGTSFCFSKLGLLPLLCGHGEGLLVLCLVLSGLAGSWPYLPLLVSKLWVAFDPLFWSDWEALRGLWRKFDSCGVVCIIYQPW